MSGIRDVSKPTIVLKGITAWERNNIHSAGFQLFKKKIDAFGNGHIKIEYAGGPEAIPTYSQGEAIQAGIADFAILSTAYYSHLVPEGTVLNYSELSVEEEWKNGALHFMNEIHNQKLNAQFLGRANGMRCSLYVNKPVQNINELKGKRFRATVSYLPFLDALGAEAVIMPASEACKAIERGVIDGVAWPEGGISELGLLNQIKYQICPAYYQVDGVMIMNLDKWNQLSKEVQDLINKAAREVEKDLPKEVSDYIENEQKTLQEAGIEQIQLPEREYVKLAYDAAWDWVLTNLPENGKKLTELFRKRGVLKC